MRASGWTWSKSVVTAAFQCAKAARQVKIEQKLDETEDVKRG